ncbi:tonB-system energizer ExbB [Hyphomicrobium sp. LHD-15]|uniref:tonB-system energizer ExbB n=1 Tax=Hyphomicrobium sp. LHD-15 TaxID=3072142 RepID=UPI00280F8755|nr:tonB-system energizer ExbB [Hyphomicrobium sp. LHD-15]MDQ8700606.1 tonB-system energizer ExbB [Hyphomicrobium sp. LHD-15]
MMLPTLQLAHAQDAGDLKEPASSAPSSVPAILEQSTEPKNAQTPNTAATSEASALPAATNSAPATEPVPAKQATVTDENSTAPSASNFPSHDVTAAGVSASSEAHSAPQLTAKPSPTKPHDLSPWGMFLQADLVVKSVMIGLVLASLVTWTVWLAKTFELWAAKRRLSKQLRNLSTANSIHEASSLVEVNRGAVPAMIRAAIAETRASWDVADKHAIKERIQARLDRVELAAGRDINRGTGLLATIGSTAPFIGLFGTVWGIMNSFIGISESQTTNLAIVAPGIAEALLATAFGLVAAIPAVIIYNHFARAIGGYKALIGDASVTVLGLVSRDLDRGIRAELMAAE